VFGHLIAGAALPEDKHYTSISKDKPPSILGRSSGVVATVLGALGTQPTSDP
jgi:hypothetical protein